MTAPRESRNPILGLEFSILGMLVVSFWKSLKGYEDKLESVGAIIGKNECNVCALKGDQW